MERADGREGKERRQQRWRGVLTGVLEGVDLHVHQGKRLSETVSHRSLLLLEDLRDLRKRRRKMRLSEVKRGDVKYKNVTERQKAFLLFVGRSLKSLRVTFHLFIMAFFPSIYFSSPCK